MYKLFIASLLVVSVQAKAKSQFEKYEELCELQTYEEELTEKNLEVIEQLDIKTITQLSADKLKMVNHHILEREYATAELSFSEIKELFVKGDERFNDLYISTIKSKRSGKVYINVESYPGDNAYGNIFLGQTGKLIGLNEDGSISIIDGGRSVSCPWN